MKPPSTPYGAALGVAAWYLLGGAVALALIGCWWLAAWGLVGAGFALFLQQRVVP